MKPLLILVALAGLAACAKQPENIAAVPMSANAFASYSCSDLAATRLTTSQTLENLSSSQRSAATGDALGVLIIGLPLSSLAGSDREAEIAVARGELQALDQQLARGGC